MSIAPVSAPSLTPSAGIAGSGSTTDGEEFAALVEQHLGGASDGSAEKPASSGEDAASTLTASGVVVPDAVTALVAGLLGGASSGTTAGSDSATTVAAEPQTAAAPVSGQLAAPLGPASAASRTKNAVEAVSGQGLEGAVVPAADVAVPAADADGSAVSLTDMSSPAPSADGEDFAATAVIAVGATTGAPAVDDSPMTARGSNPVAEQVFPPVARLVSRGDGVHRLTLRLHPADLGEVKVVLTVKDNVVDVTMSADTVAHEALRDGSPQLRSLLEAVGASAGHVVVRELTPGGTMPATTTAQPGAHQPGGQQPQGAPSDGAGSDLPGRSGRDPGHAAATRSQHSGDDLRPIRHTNPDSTSHLDLDL